MNSRFFVLASCASLLLLTGCATPTHRARQQAAVFQKLSPADQILVLHGRVRSGLSKEAVYIAWGSPDWHFEDGMGKQARETWIYERQLSTYAPLGSYDQVYVSSEDLHGPRFGYGTMPGFGYGGFGNQGFLYPSRAMITDVRFKRADFADGQLRRYEVRRGGHILGPGGMEEAPAGRPALTGHGSTATLHRVHFAGRKASTHRGLPLAQRLSQHPRQSGRTAAHSLSRRHRTGDHRNRRP